MNSGSILWSPSELFKTSNYVKISWFSQFRCAVIAWNCMVHTSLGMVKIVLNLDSVSSRCPLFTWPHAKWLSYLWTAYGGKKCRSFLQMAMRKWWSRQTIRIFFLQNKSNGEVLVECIERGRIMLKSDETFPFICICILSIQNN